MPLGFHTLLLSLEGGLLAFGGNNWGQLGLSHTNDQWVPEKVPWNGPEPVQVDWGLEHSLVLDAEGGVWQAGRSCSSISSPSFRRVPGLPCIALVTAGLSHSAAIDTQGGLWVWTNEIDLSWASSHPQRIEGLPPLTKVACGDRFLVAEAEEGLWVLGDNSQRQLGLGHISDSLNPSFVQVEECSEGPLRSLAALVEGVILIDSQGGVFSAGNNCQYQLGRESGDPTTLQRISGIPPMLAVSCGQWHVLCLDENGQVWTWGCGEVGGLGTGNDYESQPTLVAAMKGMNAVVAGRHHSLAFSEDGSLLVFGDNNFGQLALGHTDNQITPTLSPLQPALPFSYTRSKKKSARFL